ncbi:retrovirus-related pol polyprotein from transposon TNT 1-94 [Tanacetum coccineum]
MRVKESLNVTFDETPPPPRTSPLQDDDLVEEEAIEVNKTRPLGNDVEDKSLESNEIINIKESKSHPLENVTSNLNQRTFRSQAKDKIAMQEELNQFVPNDVWELVPNPKNMTIIGTKWVYRNKLDENCVVSRNKARLVAQGYTQQEGIDYAETYVPVARLESIRILLAYACTLNFKLFQMDVKSAFLNGFINEEVYVAQPPGFIDFAKPNHVYRLKKALYGLKQAPKAWHDRLKAFLIKHDYTIGMCLPLWTLPRGSQTSHLEAVKRIFRYIKATTHSGLWYPKGSGIETVVYADSDHAGDYVDRKSTSALVDYGIHLDDIPIMCDNKGAIDLIKNPVQHSRTNHIEIRHHFLRDNVQKGNISIEKVPSKDNIASILTKPLKRESFNYLRLGLGMMEQND